MIAFSLGANPPFKVVDGFFIGLGEKMTEKLVMVEKGLFLLQFANCDDRLMALSGGHLYFDKHPLTVKRWISDMSLSRGEVQTVDVDEIVWLTFSNVGALWA